MTVQEKQFANTRDASPVNFLGLPTLIRAAGDMTNQAFGLVEHTMVPPGFATPYHTHHREDESFYILDGEVMFICDGKWLKAGPGAFVFGRREVPHGFRVVGAAPARMLILCTPAGFENFVLDMREPAADLASPKAPDMNKLIALATRYKIDIHGPLPELP